MTIPERWAWDDPEDAEGFVEVKLNISMIGSQLIHSIRWQRQAGIFWHPMPTLDCVLEYWILISATPWSLGARIVLWRLKRL